MIIKGIKYDFNPLFLYLKSNKEKIKTLQLTEVMFRLEEWE
jgi:hypothetical protein